MTRFVVAAVILLIWPVASAAQDGWPAYTIESFGPAAVIVRCEVNARHQTTDCEGEFRSEKPPVLAELEDRPLVLPEAQPGHRIMLLARRPEAPDRGPPSGLNTAPGTVINLMRSRYPKAALNARREERLEAHCLIGDDGWLVACWLPDEPPDDLHLGRATLDILRWVHVTAPPAQRERVFVFDWRIPPVEPWVFVECAITPAFMTEDCTTDPDLPHLGAADAVLAALKQNPLHLAGAPVGRRIEIALLRAEIGRASKISGTGLAADYHPRSNLVTLSIRRFYPPISIRLNEEGRSGARCKVTDEGRLNECWIVASSGFKRLDHAHLQTAEVALLPLPTAESPPYDERIYQFYLGWHLS